MAKAAIATVKGLVALIAAGGWIAVMIILVICLIGLLVGSVFGVFFSGETGGSGQSMQSVVREINIDYLNRIAAIKRDNPHDILDVRSSAAT
jgi:hypothetical protein